MPDTARQDEGELRYVQPSRAVLSRGLYLRGSFLRNLPEWSLLDILELNVASHRAITACFCASGGLCPGGVLKVLARLFLLQS